MKFKVEIKKDCLGIATRLKKINKDYILVFSPKLDQFELFKRIGLNRQHLLNFTGLKLDYSVIAKVYKTRSDRINELLAEIDKQNEENETKLKQGYLKQIQKEIEKI